MLQPPTQSPSQPDSASTAALNVEIYQQDGDYIKDIEVNDLRNRYTLTKGSTQKMVNIHSCTLNPLIQSATVIALPLLRCLYKRSCSNRHLNLYHTMSWV